MEILARVLGDDSVSFLAKNNAFCKTAKLLANIKKFNVTSSTHLKGREPIASVLKFVFALPSVFITSGHGSARLSLLRITEKS